MKNFLLVFKNLVGLKAKTPSRHSEIRFLAENDVWKVYALYESVYLKKKGKNSNDKFSFDDLFIAHHYGDPKDAIILALGNYVIVSGCGLSIFNLTNKTEKHILSETTETVWTNGLHQDESDNQILEFRFVRHNKDNKLRVFKMNVETFEQVEIE